MTSSLHAAPPTELSLPRHGADQFWSAPAPAPGSMSSSPGPAYRRERSPMEAHADQPNPLELCIHAHARTHARTHTHTHTQLEADRGPNDPQLPVTAVPPDARVANKELCWSRVQCVYTCRPLKRYARPAWKLHRLIIRSPLQASRSCIRSTASRASGWRQQGLSSTGLEVVPHGIIPGIRRRTVAYCVLADYTHTLPSSSSRHLQHED
jgi:hypothetical protein